MSFDWSTVIGGVGNAASGGIVGGLFSLCGGVMTWLNAKAQFTHDEKMAELETARQQMNINAAAAAATANFKLTVEQQAGQAFTASQIAGNTFSNLPSWASAVLSMVRPAITAWTLWNSYLTYNDPTLDPLIKAEIIKANIFLGTLVLSWWFGDRQASKMIATKFYPPSSE